MSVDITIQETIDLVDITVNPNIIEVNVTRTSGGGGGTQTLEQTLILGQRTGGKNIIVDDADAVELNNGSLLKKGTYSFEGVGGGISRICSVGYEDMWQSGIRYVFDNNGEIRHATNGFNTIPDVSFDKTLRFKIDSLWTLDDGTTYVCTDASVGAAVWELQNTGTPTLQEVVNVGNVITETIDNVENTTTVNAGRTDLQSINNITNEIFTNQITTGGIGVTRYDGAGLSSQSILQPDSIFIGNYTDAGLLIKSTAILATELVTLQAPNKVTGEYTIATTDNIPTKTSDLINDGDDGISHFITLNDLPSNIIVYPTTVASDISTYFKLVSSITDPSYNTTAVDVSTGAITTTDQLISSLATSTNFIVGNPGVFNITTIGNISKVSGSGEAEFYFRVYKRTLAGTETLIVQSSNTIPVINTGYSEFSATGLWNDGTFLSTDRIVIKYYANRIAGGSNPTYQFQFGGITPVRTLLPIPLTVVPTLSLDGLSDVAITSVADKQLLSYDSATSLWKNKSVTTADIAASTNKNYVTDAQQTVIGNTSGTNTGDETTATIKTKLGITTLSGSNTGDQDLSGYSLLANTPAVILNDMRTSSAVTGTTTITVINSYLAPANTFAAFDRLQLDFLGLKSTTLGAGTYTVNINTTNSLSGSTKIAGFTISAASKFLLGQRHLAFKSATTFEIFTTSLNNAYDIGTDTNLPTTITYDTTVAYYIITTITPALTTDSFTQSRFAITRSKSKNSI